MREKKTSQLKEIESVLEIAFLKTIQHVKSICILIWTTRKNILIALIFVSLYVLFFSDLVISHKFYDDLIDQYYFRQKLLQESIHNWKLPFWTDSYFLGYPILAEAQSMYLNPLNVALSFLNDTRLTFTLMHSFFYFLGLYYYFKFLELYQLKRKYILIGAIIYFFNLSILLQQNHFNIVLSFYFLPVLLYITHVNIIKTKFSTLGVLLYYILFSFGHFQSIVIVSFILFSYVLVVMKKKQQVLLFLLTYFFGLMVSLVQFIPNLFLYLNSSRIEITTIYLEGSQSISNMMGLIYPHIYGSNPGDYWLSSIYQFKASDMYEYVNYISTIGIFFSIAGILFFKSKNDLQKRFYVWILILVFSCAFFSLGSNNVLVEQFGGYLPIYNKLRFWIRLNLAMNLGLSFSAVLFLNNIHNIKELRANFRKSSILFLIVIFVSKEFHRVGYYATQVIWGSVNLVKFDVFFMILTILAILIAIIYFNRRNVCTYILLVLVMVFQMYYVQRIFYKNLTTNSLETSSSLEINPTTFDKTSTYYFDNKDYDRNIGIQLGMKTLNGYSQLIIEGDLYNPVITSCSDYQKIFQYAGIIVSKASRNCLGVKEEYNGVNYYNYLEKPANDMYLHNKLKLKSAFTKIYRIGFLLSCISVFIVICFGKLYNKKGRNEK